MTAHQFTCPSRSPASVKTVMSGLDAVVGNNLDSLPAC